MSCQFILSFSSYKIMSQILAFRMSYLTVMFCHIAPTISVFSQWLLMMRTPHSTPDKDKEVTTTPHCCRTGNQEQFINTTFSLSAEKLMETPDFSGSPGLQYQESSRRRHSGKRCDHEMQHPQLRVGLRVCGWLGGLGGGGFISW